MCDSDQLLTLEVINKIMCAELPSKAEDPNSKLFNIITLYLIYSPYSECYPNKRYIEQVWLGKQKQCVKQFLKDFYEQTCIYKDSYLTYQQHKSSRIFSKKIKGKDVKLDCQ